MTLAKNILILLRPHQYIKNLFIFSPIFFAAKFTESELLISTFLAFLAFSLTASSIYILNDYIDIESDRDHPKKRNRPLASGAIRKPQALYLMAVFFCLGIALMLNISIIATFILLLYTGLNIAYSFHLKHIAILDVTIIAIGFALRLFIGSAASGIPLSTWIVVMTFLLALFLALAKRRDDVLIYIDTGKKMRKVVEGYNIQFLDTTMSIMASVVIVAYTIYTTSPEAIARVNSQQLYLTSLFVILGITRYLQIALVFKNSGSPTKIALTDRFIQATILGWVLTFAWLLY